MKLVNSFLFFLSLLTNLAILFILLSSSDISIKLDVEHETGDNQNDESPMPGESRRIKWGG